jgi:hypothetical protein
MNLRNDISDIENRLKSAGHSVAKLLRRAEVDASQWVRWKQGGQVPLLSTWMKITRAADDLAPRNRREPGEIAARLRQTNKPLASAGAES